MISDDRHVMAVCWFRRIDLRTVGERGFDKDYYWFEVQILLTTLLTIFLPISLIVACNIRVLTIGETIDGCVSYDFVCQQKKNQSSALVSGNFSVIATVSIEVEADSK